MTWDERHVRVEPTAADLAAIEAEWPLIEAELAVVEAEARMLRPGGPVPLDWRRLRRAERQVLAAWLRLGGGPPGRRGHLGGGVMSGTADHQVATAGIGAMEVARSEPDIPADPGLFACLDPR